MRCGPTRIPRSGSPPRPSRKACSPRGRRSGAGIRANTGVRVTTGARGPGRVNKETSQETSQVPAFGTATDRILDSGGYALKINASIGIPRTYFQGLYGSEYGTDPIDPALFDDLVESTLAEIEQQVQPLVDTTSLDGGEAGDVTVMMFTAVSECDRQAPSRRPVGPRSSPTPTWQAPSDWDHWSCCVSVSCS